ncbi:MAG TPA: tetratricopeptide repeat protein [Polyangia bacterium]|nr:tetratricopeptide repeat protein [Polyangia bacterium]
MVLLGTSWGYAQSSPEDPEVLVRAGNDLRRKGDDKRAEGYLRRAYEIAHTPRSAVQLGLVELALGSFQDADRYLSEALGSHDSWIRDHRTTIEESRANARGHLLAVELADAPLDTTATLSDGSVLNVPIDGIVWLTPGAISLTLKAPGFEAVIVNVNGAAGQRQRVPVKMAHPAEGKLPHAVGAPEGQSGLADSAVPREAGQPEGSTAQDTSGRVLRLSGIAAAGVGLATGIVGVFVWHAGNSKRDTIEAAKAPYDPADGNWQTLQRTGVGLMVSGGIVLATGVVGYLVGARMQWQRDSRVSVAVGPGFGVVGWGGRV